MSEPDVSIVIPCRNDARRLLATLAALRRQTAAVRMNVVVVDNGSDDATAEVAVSAGARVLVEPVPSAFRARNRAVRETSGPWLAFLDADCVPEPDWLEALLETAGTRGASVVSGVIDYVAEDRKWGTRLFLYRKAIHDSRRAVEEQGATPSGNLLVARAVFEACGLFDAHPYSSDIAFGRRALEAGFPPVWAPGARVRHLTSYSTGAYLRRRYATRRGQAWLGVGGQSGGWREHLRGLPWRPGFGAVKPAAAGMNVQERIGLCGVWLLLLAERWADDLGGLAGGLRRPARNGGVS